MRDRPRELAHFSANGLSIIANCAPQLAQSTRLILHSIRMFLIPALVFLHTGQWSMPWDFAIHQVLLYLSPIHHPLSPLSPPSPQSPLSPQSPQSQNRRSSIAWFTITAGPIEIPLTWSTTAIVVAWSAIITEIVRIAVTRSTIVSVVMRILVITWSIRTSVITWFLQEIVIIHIG